MASLHIGLWVADGACWPWTDRSLLSQRTQLPFQVPATQQLEYRCVEGLGKRNKCDHHAHMMAVLAQ